MKLGETLTEEQMIAAFLKGESSSPRFSSTLKEQMGILGAPLQIIETPNYSDLEENKLRKQLFAAYRGYGTNKELFENFPAEMRWRRVQLSPEEVLQIRYINYSYWNELSEDTRSPVTSAKSIQQGKEVFSVSNDQFIAAAQFLRDGGVFPEMLLVTQDEFSPLVVLEGHLRLTAYALAPGYIPNPLTAVVGFSEMITSWPEY